MQMQMQTQRRHNSILNSRVNIVECRSVETIIYTPYKAVRGSLSVCLQTAKILIRRSRVSSLIKSWLYRLDPKEYANSELCIFMKEVLLFHSFIQQLLDQNTEVFFTAAQNTYGKMTRFMRRIQNTKSTNLCLEQFLRDYQKILDLWISFV